LYSKEVFFMGYGNLKGLLLLAAVLSTVSTISLGTAEAAFGTGTASNMSVLHTASGYNPHLQDAVTASDTSIVEVTGGKIRGSVHNGIYQYLGVPYAEAAKRFVKAGPVSPWKGVKDATSYGAISPQYLFGTDRPITDVPVSNNCQNLNIWTSALDSEAKKPVMVWLHGGGFVSGSGNEGWYDGENLSRKGDVVVVAINHRLNVLGHLDLSAYGDKYKDSANVGSMDMVAALRWIRANISRFGGDPDNVTLFGQSGGGSKILELMSAPSAKGLFQKAIVQSGTSDTTGIRFTPASISREVTEETLKNLDLKPELVEELQTIPVETLWKATEKALQTVADRHQIPSPLGNGYSLMFQPVSGTDFLPLDPVRKQGFAPSGKDVPLLIGSNLNEWTTIFPFTAHKNMTDQQKILYAKAYPQEDFDTAEFVDTQFRPTTKLAMDHKAEQNGAPVYAYVFTKQVGNAGVYHTAEIPFVFSNTKEASPFADTMTALWSSFAHTGIPKAKGVPEWKPYTVQNGYTMILDDHSYLTQHHDDALMQALTND
jgi:para-nitrobenzyl esterase